MRGREFFLLKLLNICKFKKIQFSDQAGILKVRAGEWDTQTSKERLQFQERVVSQIVQHPNYNNRALYYDISIAKLESPFVLDSHIGTICLPPLGTQPQGQGIFSSFCSFYSFL